MEMTARFPGIGQATDDLTRLGRRLSKDALDRISERVSLRLKLLLLRPTASWSHTPNIRISVGLSGTGKVQTKVTIDDQIYIWVSFGTRGPYEITPKRPGYPLRFQAGFRAKTRPGSLYGGPGASYGDTVRTMRVMHPGIRPRKFHIKAFDELKPEAEKVIREEVERELIRVARS